MCRLWTCLEVVSQRLAFRDTDGGQIAVGPQTLVHNPDLRRRLHQDACTSATRGLLLYGANAPRRRTERVGQESALNVFRVSASKVGGSSESTAEPSAPAPALS